VDTLFWSIFWASAAVFIAMLCIMFVKPFRKFMMPYGFFVIIGVLMVLGVILIVMTVRQEMAIMLKAFLLLTGAAAAGMSLFAILHNLVTAIFIKFLKFSNKFDEPVFFIFATILCPLGFLVGAVGTIVQASS
jgi:hypothetical protein